MFGIGVRPKYLQQVEIFGGSIQPGDLVEFKTEEELGSQGVIKEGDEHGPESIRRLKVEIGEGPYQVERIVRRHFQVSLELRGVNGSTTLSASFFKPLH